MLQDNGQLRQIIKGHVETVVVDHFDPYIIRLARNLQRDRESFAAVRLVGECLGLHPQLTNDALVFWRIRSLIDEGILTSTS